jgi:hypothetical protein
MTAPASGANSSTGAISAMTAPVTQAGAGQAEHQHD